MAIVSRVSSGGRIVLPKELRQYLDVKEGDSVVLDWDGEAVRVTSARQRHRHAQQLVTQSVPPERSLVEELLAERRREAARE